eukprot:609096-Alexandrium_andersonii.AAC.1
MGLAERCLPRAGVRAQFWNSEGGCRTPVCENARPWLTAHRSSNKNVWTSPAAPHKCGILQGRQEGPTPKTDPAQVGVCGTAASLPHTSFGRICPPSPPSGPS